MDIIKFEHGLFDCSDKSSCVSLEIKDYIGKLSGYEPFYCKYLRYDVVTEMVEVQSSNLSHFEVERVVALPTKLYFDIVVQATFKTGQLVLELASISENDLSVNNVTFTPFNSYSLPKYCDNIYRGVIS